MTGLPFSERNEFKSQLVLAIRPFTKGFAFVLFEGPLSPVDWGIRMVARSERNARTLSATTAIIDRAGADIIVLENVEAEHHSRRITRLHALIASHARGQGLDVITYERHQIQSCFFGVGAVTRYQIAQAIAGHIHAFSHRVPRPRKVWESEDPRMSLFDAVALVVTHYCLFGSPADS